MCSGGATSGSALVGSAVGPRWAALRVLRRLDLWAGLRVLRRRDPPGRGGRCFVCRAGWILLDGAAAGSSWARGPSSASASAGSPWTGRPSSAPAGSPWTGRPSTASAGSSRTRRWSRGGQCVMCSSGFLLLILCGSGAFFRCFEGWIVSDGGGPSWLPGPPAVGSALRLAGLGARPAFGGFRRTFGGHLWCGLL